MTDADAVPDMPGTVGAWVASNFGGLQALLEQVQPERAGSEIVYRGQTTDHPALESSLSRESRARPEGIAEQFWTRLHAASSAMMYLSDRGLLEPLGGRYEKIELSTWNLAEAIVQHYGYRSQYLDVTRSVDVALWFAKHRFRTHGELVQERDGQLCATLPAWYEAGQPGQESGVLLAIEAPLWDARRPMSPGDLIDLPGIAPEGVSRIARQEAAAIFAPFDRDRPLGYADAIRARIRLEFSWKQARRDWRTGDLFPPPEVDSLYRHFLTAPFFRTRYPSDEEREFACLSGVAEQDAISTFRFEPEDDRPLMRRSLLLPEYHDDRFDTSRLAAYRETDRFLEPTLYFNWLATNARQIEIESDSGVGTLAPPDSATVIARLSRAFPILLTRPRLLFSMQVGAPHDPRSTRLEVPRLLTNFFLEFGPESFTHPWEPERMLRGAWFTAPTDATVEIRLLGTRRSKPWITRPIVYEWTDADGYAVRAGVEDWQHFSLASRLIDWLKTDHLRLTDPGTSPNGYAEIQGGERFSEILDRIRWL